MIALIKRDLQLALRGGSGVALGLGFFVVFVVLVPFAIGPQLDVLARLAPSILWLGALLACLLSLDRIFHFDYEDGSLDLLATSPMPLENVVIAKCLAHWFTTGLPLTLITPLLGIGLNMPAQAYMPLLISLIVGTPALSIIGTFGAALIVAIRRGGLLLSVIVLPLYVPVLIFGTQMAQRGAQGLDHSVALICLASITLGGMAFMPYICTAVLRVNLR